MASKRKSPYTELKESIDTLAAVMTQQKKASEEVKDSFRGFAMWNAQDKLFEVFSQAIGYQTRSIALGKTALQVQQENNDNLKDLNVGLSIKLEEQLNALESGISGSLKGTLQLATRMNALGENTNLLWATLAEQKVILGMSNSQLDSLAEEMNNTAESFSINREKLVGAMQQLGKSLAGMSLTANVEGIQRAQTQLLGVVGAGFTNALPQLLGPIFESTAESMERDFRLGIQKEVNKLRSGEGEAEDMVRIFRSHLKTLEFFTKGINDPQILKVQTQNAAKFMSTTVENLAIMRSVVEHFETGMKKDQDQDVKRAQTFAKTFSQFQSEVLEPLMQVLTKTTEVFTAIITKLDDVGKYLGYAMGITAFGVMGKSVGAKMFGLSSLATGISSIFLRSIPILGTGILTAEILGFEPVKHIMELLGSDSKKQTDIQSRSLEEQEKQSQIQKTTLKEIEEQNKVKEPYQGSDIHSLNKELINRMLLVRNESYSMSNSAEKAEYQRDLMRAQNEEIKSLLASLNSKMSVMSKKGPIQ